MDNNHEGWAQGYFVDQPQYRHWPQSEKDNANKSEKLKVRPSPKGNAICHCSSPEEAEWIARRLNLAAKLEKKARQENAE